MFRLGKRSCRRRITASGVVRGLVAAAAALLLAAAPAEAATSSQLVAVSVTNPGSDPSNDTPVLLYRLLGDGTLMQLPSIPETYLHDPGYVAFGPSGDLFVSNRFGNSGPGSIARFRLGPNGEILKFSTISGNGLSAVHGLAFGPNGDLYAGNRLEGTISHFRFGSRGEPIAAGATFVGFPPQSLLFTASGTEMQVSLESSVARLSVDPATGDLTPFGSFTVPGPVAIHGMAFRHGRLYVADPYTDTIYAVGKPAADVHVEGGPVTFAFSRTGELFTASHFEGRISRFTFAADDTPIAGPVLDTDEHLGGIAIRRPMPTCDGLEATQVALPGQTTIGTLGDDVIAGTSGADSVESRAGDDHLCGGDGADTLRGAAGEDVVRGGDGADLVSGGSGADLLTGGADDDHLIGGNDDDRLDGGDGVDRCSGGAGADSVKNC